MSPVEQAHWLSSSRKDRRTDEETVPPTLNSGRYFIQFCQNVNNERILRTKKAYFFSCGFRKGKSHKSNGTYLSHLT
jgi:hypothetical protein